MHRPRVICGLDAVADARRRELLDDLRDLLHRPRFARVDRDAQALPPAALEQPAVVGRPKIGRLRTRDVDADHAAHAVGDRLLGDDLVEGVGERTIKAEEQAGRDRVLEHRPVHAADCGVNDVVKVLLAAAVALHRVEAQLGGGDVVLAVRAADDLVDGALHGDRRRLDQLGPVEQLEVAVEGPSAPRGHGDQVAELPVVLRRQADALGVGDAPHDGRRDRPAEMAVQFGQGPGARQLAGHCSDRIEAAVANKRLAAGRSGRIHSKL